MDPYHFSNGDGMREEVFTEVLNHYPPKLVNIPLAKRVVAKLVAERMPRDGGSFVTKRDAPPLVAEACRRLDAESELPARVAKSSAGEVSRTVPILKLDKAQRIVTGVAMEPVSTPDTQGDVISAPEIERAMYSWIENQKKIGLQHAADVTDKITVLENWIQREDVSINGQPVAKGSWLMSVRVNDDDLWTACLTGAISGFSIAGTADRRALAA